MYEFRCKECGYTLDIKATIAEKENGLSISCEKCGSSELEQIFGGFSLLTGHPAGTRGDAGGGCCGGGSPKCC